MKLKSGIVLIVMLVALAGPAFAGSKTEFRDGSPSTGVKGTSVTAEFLNKTSYGVPTGENQQGSFPTLYSLDNGTTNSFSVKLYQGNTRVVSTNTGTAANKLIDSLATFQTDTVVTGDVVLNLTDRTSTTVTAIDSQTQLSLAADIFTATSKSYAVGRDIQQLPQAYVAGQTISFKALNANTGAATINVNGLGVKAIKKNGSAALVSGDIPAGAIVELVYDGTNFQMISTQPVTVTAVTAQKLTDGTNLIRAKAFDLGTWDMDATATKQIATGFTDNSKILGAMGIIRFDTDYVDIAIPFSGCGNNSLCPDDVYILAASNNVHNIYIDRKTGGIFDGVNANSTSQSRGWVIIFYTE